MTAHPWLVQRDRPSRIVEVGRRRLTVPFIRSRLANITADQAVALQGILQRHEVVDTDLWVQAEWMKTWAKGW